MGKIVDGQQKSVKDYWSIEKRVLQGRMYNQEIQAANIQQQNNKKHDFIDVVGNVYREQYRKRVSYWTLFCYKLVYKF